MDSHTHISIVFQFQQTSRHNIATIRVWQDRVFLIKYQEKSLLHPKSEIMSLWLKNVRSTNDLFIGSIRGYTFLDECYLP